MVTVKSQSYDKVIRIFYTLLFSSIIISFHGILIFCLLKFLGISTEIKKFLFEFFIFLFISFSLFERFFIVRNLRVNFANILFILLFLLKFLQALLSETSIIGILYSVKEVWLWLIVLLLLYKRRDFINEKIIVNLLLTLNTLNLIFTMLLLIIGYEKVFIFIFGKTFYGLSEEFNFKISHFYGFLRSPALIGESAQYGFFSVYSFIIFYHFKKNKYMFLALLNLLLSISRTAYLMLLIFVILDQIFRIKSKLGRKTISKKTVFTFIIITNLLLIFLLLNISSISEFLFDFYQKLKRLDSLMERQFHWKEIINTTRVSIFDHLVGPLFGHIGTAYNYSELGLHYFWRVVDNGWLFLYYNLGWIGICIFMYVLLSSLTFSHRNLAIIISFFISMLFVNVFQGEVTTPMLALTLSITSNRVKLGQIERYM